MTKPVIFSAPSSVFCELSKGKVGKDGRITIQKGSKGQTCSFYAMKRLLTTEQIRSDHGKCCSLYRKRITVDMKGVNKSSETAIMAAISKADNAFLQAKGLDPKEAGIDCYIETFLSKKFDRLAPAVIRDALSKHLSSETQLKYTNAAVIYHMAKGHDLRDVSFKDIDSVEKLITTMKRTGPLMVAGIFGLSLYREPAKELEAKIQGNKLYGWKKGAPTFDVSEKIVSHGIVIVGADKKEDRGYVYWIDPSDSNDPYNGGPIYMSSFQSISTNMLEFFGNKLSLEERANFIAAFYNPRFAP